jgi:hypothetical protein
VDKNARDIARLSAELARLRSQVVVRPAAPAAADNDETWIEIIGGNALASGYDCIQYADSVTPAAVYDPDVDTSYPVGLGNGYLWINGERQADRVLVRHRFSANQVPIEQGRPVQTSGTETLSYSGTDMTAYLVYWL